MFHKESNARNEDVLITNIGHYYKRSLEVLKEFGGPSVYFHVQSIKEQEAAFLSDRHIEMIFATLASWGMHKMGNPDETKTKLVEYSDFRKSILRHHERLHRFCSLRMDSCTQVQYEKYVYDLTRERGSSTETLMRYGGFYLPGFMLAGFGLLLLTKFSHSKVAIVTALFVILSAIARFAAGMFPCDPSCMPINPSFSQKMHNLSAVLAAFFLAGSGCLWFFSSRKLLGAPWFGWYSLLSAVLGIVFMFLAAATAATREGVGLFQRISLGVLHLWVLMLALAVWRSSRSFSANPSLHRIADKPGSRRA